MQITEINYEEFYFGHAAECYIQGEFYTLGYEALKTTPDIGYDLLVTNCARTKFLGEEPKQFNIQIKSRVCSANKTTFCIKKEDLNCLINDPKGILICVFCTPNFSYGRENITIYRTQDSLSSDFIETLSQIIFNKDEYPTFKKLKEKMIPYVGFSKNYIWFNSAHLQRLLENDYFFEYKDNYCLSFGISDEVTYPLDKNGNKLETSPLYGANGYYAYELSQINYLVEPSPELRDGCMFCGDRYF